MGDERLTTASRNFKGEPVHCGPRSGAEGDLRMSAIPSDVRLESDASEPEQRRRALPRAAAAYGVADWDRRTRRNDPAPVASRQFGHVEVDNVPDSRGRRGRISHLDTVRTARDTAFHTSWVFLIPERVAAAARARRAARRRHARARMAQGAVRPGTSRASTSATTRWGIWRRGVQPRCCCAQTE